MELFEIVPIFFLVEEGDERKEGKSQILREERKAKRE